MFLSCRSLFVILILLKVALGGDSKMGPSAPYIDESLPEPSHTLQTHQKWGVFPRRPTYRSNLDIPYTPMPHGGLGSPPPPPMMGESDSNEEKNSSLSMELAPLYPGYGTHYAYIYVGTPPKRQSVIIDTG